MLITQLDQVDIDNVENEYQILINNQNNLNHEIILPNVPQNTILDSNTNVPKTDIKKQVMS